jgi:hypothetical protein
MSNETETKHTPCYLNISVDKSLILKWILNSVMVQSGFSWINGGFLQKY